MTHEKFESNPTLWNYDYLKHFKLFQKAIANAMILYFPNYSLPWVLRTDASDLAVGSVLYQIFTTDAGDIQYQPINFSSKRFSGPASSWDTYKKEAFGIYEGVNSNAFYLLAKTFVIQTDHRNLQFIEQSKQPIIIRWRSLLQNYQFLIEHIPGRENRVADFLSRMPVNPEFILPVLAPLVSLDPVEPTFNSIMKEVHGGRSLHFGAYETWRLAKFKYPNSHIPLSLVQIFVKECVMCQKTRNTGIKGLKSQTLTLKPDTYRRTIGVDHVTITPKDKNGNTCAIVIVEHFAHFPQVYAASTYDVITLAIILFKHICIFGLFDQIATDPGSAMMADTLQQLNQWLGIHHKVSLVGRHESNGCEGTNKQLIRHLRTLVFDERLIDKWSDDTVLPLINFVLCSFPTSETGGLTPFQLKYGTLDASYFHLPTQSPSENASSLLIALDANLKIVRAASLQLQQQIVLDRKKADGVILQYEVGDMILWNPSDMLATKLSPPFLGPYKVVKQVKNDIECIHVVTHDVKVIHVDRVKPFFGTDEEAYSIGKLDKDQYDIISINYFTGNPYVRTSLLFNVTFEGGSVVMLPYTLDLSQSAPFILFINSSILLFPLRTTALVFNRYLVQRSKMVISSVLPGDAALLHLRYYDSYKLSWYEKLDLPLMHYHYFISVNAISYANRQQTKLNMFAPIFNSTFVLTSYEVMIFIINDQQHLPADAVVIDDTMVALYDKLEPWIITND